MGVSADHKPGGSTLVTRTLSPAVLLTKHWYTPYGSKLPFTPRAETITVVSDVFSLFPLWNQVMVVGNSVPAVEQLISTFPVSLSTVLINRVVLCWGDVITGLAARRYKLLYISSFWNWMSMYATISHFHPHIFLQPIRFLKWWQITSMSPSLWVDGILRANKSHFQMKSCVG